MRIDLEQRAAARLTDRERISGSLEADPELVAQLSRARDAGVWVLACLAPYSEEIMLSDARRPMI